MLLRIVLLLWRVLLLLRWILLLAVWRLLLLLLRVRLAVRLWLIVGMLRLRIMLLAGRRRVLTHRLPTGVDRLSCHRAGRSSAIGLLSRIHRSPALSAGVGCLRRCGTTHPRER